MTEFVGLWAKLYAYRTFEGGEDKRCKGIKTPVIRNEMNFDNYKDCLHTKKTNTDHKRHILEDHEDGIHTLAWGHYNFTHTYNLG